MSSSSKMRCHLDQRSWEWWIRKLGCTEGYHCWGDKLLRFRNQFRRFHLMGDDYFVYAFAGWMCLMSDTSQGIALDIKKGVATGYPELFMWGRSWKVWDYMHTFLASSFKLVDRGFQTSILNTISELVLFYGLMYNISLHESEIIGVSGDYALSPT